MLGPIFAREFLTVPRRASHYTARAASLGLLWVVGVTAWLTTNAFGRAPNLGESARFAADLKRTNPRVTFVEVPRGGHYDSMIREGIPKAIEWFGKLRG